MRRKFRGPEESGFIASFASLSLSLTAEVMAPDAKYVCLLLDNHLDVFTIILLDW